MIIKKMKLRNKEQKEDPYTSSESEVPTEESQENSEEAFKEELKALLEKKLVTFLTGISKQMASLDQNVSRLEKVFEEKIQNDNFAAKSFQKLYEEYDYYRQDFVFKQVKRRIFEDLFNLIDRMDSLFHDSANRGSEPAMLLDHIESFIHETLLILKRQGVSELNSPEDYFNESTQEALSIQQVESAEGNMRVLKRMRRGFAYEGKVMRPEGVLVGKYNLLDTENNG